MSGDQRLQAAAKLVLEHLASAGEVQRSPTLEEMWPDYWATEARHLKSSKRSQASWDAVRKLKIEGVELEKHEALAVTPERMEVIRSIRRSTINNRGTPNKAATVNREIIVMKRFLAWAVETGRIPYSPLVTFHLEPNHSVRQSRINEERDLTRLLAACSPMTKALVLVLYDGGLRRLEAMQLRRDQIEKKPGGGAIVRLPGAKTKNKKPRRPRISARAMEALERLPNFCEFFFANPKTKKPYCERQLYRRYQEAVKAAGLKGVDGENIVLHTLRHSFAYNRRTRDHWAETTIMAQGGWKTRSMLDRYGIVDDQELDEAMDRVERRLAGTTKGPAAQPANTVRDCDSLSSDVAHETTSGNVSSTSDGDLFSD